ncbi:MAG: magnesium chelatase subunit H [Pseudomonadota bacterium]
MLANKDIYRQNATRRQPPAALNIVVLSMDGRLSAAALKAQNDLRSSVPGLRVSLHVVSDFERDPSAVDKAIADIEDAHFIVGGLLFLENQIAPILPALRARAPECDAVVGCLSTPDIVKLTRLGSFALDRPDTALTKVLKKLRGGKSKNAPSQGAKQMNVLRQLPKVLKFIPGPAQDLRAYFLCMQYWLAGTDENFKNMIAFLIERYAATERGVDRSTLTVGAPVEAPEVGLYHPDIDGKVVDLLSKLPGARTKKPTVGLLLLRSYVMSDDVHHYDCVIRALEAKGLRVIPAFAGGLDARPAIDKFFVRNGEPIVDALVSLSGFSLIGGPAYNDASAAADLLDKMDVPYLAAHALEFQTLDGWQADNSGLTPIEATMMVAIPELDGATNPMVFGGRSGSDATGGGRRMHGSPERAEMLARRTLALVRLRRKLPLDRKIGIVLFNFPPNSGAAGTAAYLSVFNSLFNTLKELKTAGYNVDLPENAEALKDKLLKGNSEHFGADANVAVRIPTVDYVRTEKRLEEIEKQWGPAPGVQQADGSSIHVLGAEFGSVFVGLQPAFGVEGDPMKLLFEGGFTPTHAFAGFYRWLREDFGADALLHFGTHGALEFMPGKQTGMSGACWSDYLIGETPNIYFYAANNPSEAAIAKRRSAATTVSYLTPSITKAGLYKGLLDLKSSLERVRSTSSNDNLGADKTLIQLIQTQAAELDLAQATPEWSQADAAAHIDEIQSQLHDFENALIPEGLHIAGEGMSRDARITLLSALSEASENGALSADIITEVAGGADPSTIARQHKQDKRAEEITDLATVNSQLKSNQEMPALLRALRGGFTPPAPGGDVIRNKDVLPTGRNIHGFDPFRMPSAYAVADGARQAERIIDRAVAETGSAPRTAAIVLWGADNLKSEGAQIAQALAMMGTRPTFDSFGRLTGAELISIEELGRPRIDVILTVSGIFRDLLPLQTRLLADAALKAANADEPADLNPIRHHALAYQSKTGCSFETAALRVFSNSQGAYGSNVNQLVDAGCWDEADELADAYSSRKCYAYGTTGDPAAQPELLNSILENVDMSYQNLESVELGVTTIDHYFDTLGGIAKAVSRAKGKDAPVLIGDQTRTDGVVRTLNEQLKLETRTRTLNPKWYEGMLSHGYEGVRQIEAQVTNTLGWSATTNEVDPWVYQEISETFVLDENLRNRLAELNPKSCMRVANRLLEACERDLWTPSPETLEALQRAGEELEDRLEVVYAEGGAAA